MEKNFIDISKEIINEFSFKNFLTDKQSDPHEGIEKMILVSAYRPINLRGRDQFYCLIAHLKTWKNTGDTVSYCHSCSYFLKMTCLESIGYSEECRKGHYRFEAT